MARWAAVWVSAILPHHDDVRLVRAVANFALIVGELGCEAAFKSGRRVEHIGPDWVVVDNVEFSADRLQRRLYAMEELYDQGTMEGVVKEDDGRGCKGR